MQTLLEMWASASAGGVWLGQSHPLLFAPVAPAAKAGGCHGDRGAPGLNLNCLALYWRGLQTPLQAVLWAAGRDQADGKQGFHVWGWGERAPGRVAAPASVSAAHGRLHASEELSFRGWVNNAFLFSQLSESSFLASHFPE